MAIKVNVDSRTVLSVVVVNHGFGNMYELYCEYSGYKKYIYTFYSLQDLLSSRFVNNELKEKVRVAVK